MALNRSVRNSVRIRLESGLFSVRGHCAKKVYVCTMPSQKNINTRTFRSNYKRNPYGLAASRLCSGDFNL